MLLFLLPLALFYPQHIAQREEGALRRSLLCEAQAMLPYLRETVDHGTAGALQSKVTDIGRRTESRITVIRPDGEVLADSNSDPRQIENQAGKAEVKAAISGEIGSSVGFSGTGRRRMLYVAIPAIKDAEGYTVLRAARSAAPLDAQARSERRFLLGIAFAAAGLAIIWALVGTRQIRGSLRSLQLVAAEIGSGNYDTEVPKLGLDEIGQLSDTLGQMAARLRGSVSQLASQEEKLRHTLSNLPDGVITVDDSGRIQIMNAAAAEICGVSAEASTGKNLLESTIHYGLAAVAGEAAREGKAAAELRFGSGGERVVSAIAARWNSTLENEGIVLVLRDLTEENRINKVRSDFLADASHELRTPIAGIRALAESIQLSHEAGAPFPASLIEELLRQSARTGEMVNDLLSLAAIESGQRSFVKQDIEVKELLSDVRAQFSQALRKKSLTCVIECEPMHITTDVVAVRQIIRNILDNAIRHTPDGRCVFLRARQDDNSCVIVIRDEGEGISPTDLPRIFERFYRSGSARDRETGGTGLGLSIAKHLAQALGGSIEAESRLGEGALFRVNIPVA